MDPAAAPAGLDLFTPLQPYLAEIISLVIGSLMLAGLRLLQKHLGIQASAEHQQAILAAVERATGAALRRYGPELQRITTIESDNPAVIEAAEYVKTQLPKRLKQMGMGEKEVRAFVAKELESRLDIELPPPAEMTDDEIKRKLVELLDLLQQRKVIP